MVPFADLFNHKAAVVQLGGGYFVEDICFEGQGSSDSGGEEPGDEEDQEEELGSEDSEVNQAQVGQAIATPPTCNAC